jgi:hypothetical protein
MIRSMGFLVVAAGLAFSACGSSEKKSSPAPTATFTPAPDEQALVGTWSDGSTTLELRANKTYSFEANRGAGRTSSTGGKWQLRAGALYLTPDGQSDEVYDFQWGAEQRSLSLSTAKGGSWNLSKR